MFFMPIVALFYFDNGLDAQAIFTLQAIYSVTIVILEIPSGYFADVWGRKNSLVIGSVLGFFGFLTYSFSDGFYGFLVAEIILGIGHSFISGSDSAMLYDSLLDLNSEKRYAKLEGRLTAIGNFAESAAAIIGGFLAEISLRTPYIAQTVVAFFAIPAALGIVNPASHKKLYVASLKNVLQIVYYSLFKNISLRNNILLSSVIGCATLSMAWFAQIYFKELGLTKSLIGVLWTLLNLSVGITSWMAYKIEHRLGQTVSIFIITVGIPLGYFFSGIFFGYLGIAVLFYFYLVRGFATPVLKDYINQDAPSDSRATILSVRSFIIRLLFALMGPFFGFLTDNLSLQKALLITAGIFFLLANSAAVAFIVHKRRSSV